jgi:hypothetical protein
MIIELTEDEANLLILALGVATGAAVKDGNCKLADAFFALAGSVTKNVRGAPHEILAKAAARIDSV